MYPIDLRGKHGIVFGVANHKSIAWAIAQVLLNAGANLTIAYQNERLKDRVSALIQDQKNANLLECDVSSDDNIEKVFSELRKTVGTISFAIHCIAYARKEDLGGLFSETSRDGFQAAMDISAYSFLPVAKYAAQIMDNGGSILTLTFEASEKVYPGYNIMGTAKAALENEVKQLASEFGERNIRVNAISPGPLETLAARGIRGFVNMKRIHEERAPLRRNITHEEVANVALFLCSDLSSGMTGNIIPVDAGYHIMGV